VKLKTFITPLPQKLPKIIISIAYAILKENSKLAHMCMCVLMFYKKDLRAYKTVLPSLLGR